MNLDSCRVPFSGERVYTTVGRGFARLHELEKGAEYHNSVNPSVERDNLQGRHPANVILCPEGRIEIDKQSGPFKAGNYCQQSDGAHPFGNAAGSPYRKLAGIQEDSSLGVGRVFWNVKE